MKKVAACSPACSGFWLPCWWSIKSSPTLPSTTCWRRPSNRSATCWQNQVKLIFPVDNNQLALSEDAEALVYVTTGSDIYTQSEAEQHGLNDSKPYPIWSRASAAN